MPKLAIVIPTYNPTQQCYENILNYLNIKLDDYFIYVVNNNSDKTEFIDKLKDHPDTCVEDSIYGGAFEAGALLQAYQKISFEGIKNRKRIVKRAQLRILFPAWN